MEKYNIYFKKFQIAILIFVAAILAIIFLIYKTVPVVQKIFDIQEQQKTQSASLADAERRLADLRADAERRKVENENLPKLFFKPVNMGLDTEAAISEEFAEILQIIRENKIKTRSIVYEYDPKDDNFVKNVPEKYQVCRITAEMIANYSNFENFLRDLYKHEHYLEIAKIEILPYEKNKRILLINMQLKLYAQRDPSTYIPAAAPADQNAASGDNASGTKVPSPQKIDTSGGISPEATQ